MFCALTRTHSPSYSVLTRLEVTTFQYKVICLYTLNVSPFDHVVSTPTRELIDSHLSFTQCLRKYGEEGLVSGDVTCKLPITQINK